MPIQTGDVALAVRAGGGWNLRELERAEVGRAGLVVPTPVDFGVFAAYPPEVDADAVVVASPGGIPAVVRTVEESGEIEGNPPVGGGDCFGPHPFCSRIFCTAVLYNRYLLTFAGFDTSCGPQPLAGTFTVRKADDCTWEGTGNGWDLRLYFHFSGNQVAWEASAQAGLLIAAAHTTYTDPLSPEYANFVLVQSPCVGGPANPDDGGSILVTAL